MGKTKKNNTYEAMKYRRERDLANARNRKYKANMSAEKREALRKSHRERYHRLRREKKIKLVNDMTEKEKKEYRKIWKKQKAALRKKKKEEKENFKKEQGSNTVASILAADTQVKQVALVRDNVPPRSKSITVSLHSQPPPPPPLNPAPASTIKVVDLKNLLPPQPQPHPTEAVKRSADSQVPVTSVSSVLNSLVSKYTLNKPTSHTAFVNRTCVTASQVLTCLRVILPGNFDLSRMIPNEKVASLIIRYLKLDEKNEEIQNVVKEHLRIIIEAVKIKKKRSLGFTKHPYRKITDRNLKHALAVILPENFSMIDITDELLGLICITLNLDIYTDAYYILRRKIRKFTSEGQKFSEILNRGNKVYNASLEVERDVEVSEVTGNVTISEVDLTLADNENSSDSEVEYIGEKRRELEFIDVNNLPEKSQEPVDLELSTESFLNYFNLCRHDQISSRNSNEKDVGSKLNYTIDNKINMNNVKDYFQQFRTKRFRAKQYPKQSRQLTSNKSSNTVKNKSDEKLKMKPVVVIEDLLDYKSNQLLFMKNKKVESNGFCNQIPFSLKQSSSNQNYSAEQVRKLTDDSYKQFRKIFLKRDGTKAVFRVKYAKLKPGTVVFAKNFRHPEVGWVKGVVSKPEGPLKYQVKLDNNSMWCCTVDQLRPLLNNVVSSVESRRNHRPNKPKELFDL